MYLFLILLIGVILTLFLMEAPAMWKQRLIPDLVVFCVLLGISTYLGLAQIYGWTIPNLALALLRLFGGSA